MTDVSLLVALAAGTVALLSPCSALLLPSFFAYAFSSRTALLLRTGVFYIGLTLTLVPLGVGASAASTLLYGHRQLLISIAGWVLIGLGVGQLLGWGFALPLVGRLQQRTSHLTRGTSWASTLVLGAVYGLAGFCSGPVLGAILTVAATHESPISGGLLLATYALGMAAPLFLLALAWDRLKLGQRRWVRGRMIRLGPLRIHTTSLMAGLMFIAIGVLFLRYDGTAGLTGQFLGNTADLEFTAQAALTRWLSEVPVWTVPAAIAAIAALVAWRSSRKPQKTPEQTTAHKG